MHRDLSFAEKRTQWPAIHLSRNTQKWAQNAKSKKCMVGYFASLFSGFTSLFRFLYFAPGSTFTQKVKGFRGLFFAALIKHKIHIKCEKCIVSVLYFVACFAKNTREMRKVYSRPTMQHECVCIGSPYVLMLKRHLRIISLTHQYFFILVYRKTITLFSAF